jgi:hypothetical protein
VRSLCARLPGSDPTRLTPGRRQHGEGPQIQRAAVTGFAAGVVGHDVEELGRAAQVGV